MELVFVFLVLIAGMLAPAQAGINAELSRFLHSNFLAALVSFCVGTAALLLYSLAMRIPWPPASVLSKTPWWVWLGGLCGAYLVTVTITAAPRLGATAMFGAFLTGQLMASLLLDHFGLLGYPVHPVNPWRVLGVALLFAGVFLVRRF
jgi:transporter family-2 protein